MTDETSGFEPGPGMPSDGLADDVGDAVSPLLEQKGAEADAEAARADEASRALIHGPDEQPAEDEPDQWQRIE